MQHHRTQPIDYTSQLITADIILNWKEEKDEDPTRTTKRLGTLATVKKVGHMKKKKNTTSEKKGANFDNIPGVSITRRQRPSFLVVDWSSHVDVMADELARDLNALTPSNEFPVALFPLPVRPTSTNVVGVGISQSPSLATSQSPKSEPPMTQQTLPLPLPLLMMSVSCPPLFALKKRAPIQSEATQNLFFFFAYSIVVVSIQTRSCKISKDRNVT